MAQVALNGTSINQSIKSDYISYEYGVYDPCRYQGTDSEGNPTCSPGYWWYSATSNAIINGSVSCNNRVYANGISIAKAGDNVNETWTNSGFNTPNRNISPGSNGSGSGTIASNANSSNVYINGRLVAVRGSTVNTHLSTNTTLNTPTASRINIG